MIQGNDNMGKGLHDKTVYGREMAQLLDDAFAHWSRADVVAEYHSYENEEANDRADARWARYQQLKAQAQEIRYPQPATEAPAPRTITEDEAQYLGYWAGETYPRGMVEVLRYLEVR